jgi:hypothetical protein
MGAKDCKAKYLIMKKILSLLFFLLVSMAIGQAQKGCDSLIQVINNDAGSLSIKGMLGEEQAEGTFEGFIELKSMQGATVDLQASTLKDDYTGTLIASRDVELSASNMTFKKGERAELFVNIKGKTPGNYSGTILLSPRNSDCEVEVKIAFSLTKKGAVKVSEIDAKQTIKTVPPNIVGVLLPPRINQKSISFRIENNSKNPITLDTYTFSLVGEGTNNKIPDSQLIWQEPNMEILPKGEQVVSFKLDRKNWSIAPDKYTGNLKVHVKNYTEPLNVEVTLFSRTRIWIAVILLLIGIIVGRIVRDLNKRKGQMNLMNRLLPLYTRINKIKEDQGRDGLWAQAKALEAKIEAITDEKSAKALEDDFTRLEKKIKQYQQLEVLNEKLFDALENFLEDIEDDEAIEEVQNEAVSKLEFVGDAILKGNDEKIKAGTLEIVGLIDRLSKSAAGSKSVTSSAVSKTKEAAARNVAEQLQETEAEKTELPETPTSRVTRILTSILGFLTGIKVDARTRYAFFRPLVGLITLTIIVLMGFQEIYIEGGDTFGSEGIYDYLKLFLWGIISDVFSRTLLSEEVKALAATNKEGNANA